MTARKSLMDRPVHVCTSCGVGMPALRKAAAAEIFAKQADAQFEKGRVKPVTTNVSRYISRKAPSLARSLRKILATHRKRIAAKAKKLYAATLQKDVAGEAARIAAILENLGSDDLGLDLQGDLAPAMLAAFRRAAAIGATQVGFSIDDITNQVDKAAVAYADDRGGILIKDLAGTTEDAMRALLARAVDEGMSADELSGAIEQMGAFGDYRADVIARTELAYAHVAGNMEGWKASDQVVGKRWILGDLHDVPDECDDAADAGVVGIDEEFVDGIDAPPAHPNCCLPGTVVAPAGRIAAHFARSYKGEVVDIGTARSRLSVTPNHPVLTRRGWVAAGALEIGDRILECLDPAAALAAVDPDNDDVPTRIEEVARALLMAGGVASRSMPSTAEAFHGDGMSDGEVDVVWAASALELDRETGLLKKRVHSLLGFGHRGRRAFPVECRPAELVERDRAPANSVMGSGDARQSDLRRQSGVDEKMALAAVANSQVVALEDVPERRAVAADALGKIDGRLAGHVACVNGGDIGLLEAAPSGVDIAGAANLNSLLGQKSLDDLVRDGQLPGQGADRLAGLVTSAEITQLTRRHFEGTVHNVSTRYGWYFADGIAVHNCVCDILPVLDDSGNA